jgi:DNA-binding XRE family transcriptional regulator
MTVTVAQLRAGRAFLDWTTQRLAKAAQVHRETIGKIEGGRAVAQKATMARLVSALEQAGVVFAKNGMVGVNPDILRFSATATAPRKFDR